MKAVLLSLVLALSVPALAQPTPCHTCVRPAPGPLMGAEQLLIGGGIYWEAIILARSPKASLIREIIRRGDGGNVAAGTARLRSASSPVKAPRAPRYLVIGQNLHVFTTFNSGETI